MKLETVAATKAAMIELIVAKELDRLDGSSSDESEDEQYLKEESSQQKAKRHWKKAQKVLHLVAAQRSADVISATSAAGLRDIQASAEDAKQVLSVMKQGISSGKTQFKIAIGLFQVLGEVRYNSAMCLIHCFDRISVAYITTCLRVHRCRRF